MSSAVQVQGIFCAISRFRDSLEISADSSAAAVAVAELVVLRVAIEENCRWRKRIPLVLLRVLGIWGTEKGKRVWV